MKTINVQNEFGAMTITIMENKATAKIKITNGENTIEQIKALLQVYKNSSGTEGGTKLSYNLQSIDKDELIVGGIVSDFFKALKGLDFIDEQTFSAFSSYLSADPTNNTVKAINSGTSAVSTTTTAPTAALSSIYSPTFHSPPQQLLDSKKHGASNSQGKSAASPPKSEPPNSVASPTVTKNS